MDAAGEVVLRIPAPGAGIRDVALSPDGRILAAGGLDGVARIWSVEGGALLAELHGHGDRIARVEFGPDGSWLATGSWDRSARRWDLSGLSRPVATVVEEVRRDWGGEDGEVPGGG
ncbi:hypothetical protein L6R50_24675 [Myxococcota bacterium]|nr:hypothetical protein [Myxococcota bacterium]